MACGDCVRARRDLLKPRLLRASVESIAPNLAPPITVGKVLSTIKGDLLSRSAQESGEGASAFQFLVS